MTQSLVYIGTYTTRMGHVKGTPAAGIPLFQFDAQAGTLKPYAVAEDIPNPSFLAFHPNGRFLYAVNEWVADDPFHGAVSAFAIDAPSGSLSFINRHSSLGGAPCHLSVDRSGRFLLVANYVGGNVLMYPLGVDGSLSPACVNLPHRGYGPDPARQAASHAHSIWVDADNRFVLACDLGLDKVIVYRLDLDNKQLSPHAAAVLPAGSGPRHLAFHPNHRFVYVIGELGGTMTALEWNPTQGSLGVLETCSTLPADYTGPKSCADVHVHPSGKFLYGSNRGHDSLAIYAIDEQTGRLTLIGHESTRGKTPRNFSLDPSGQFLVVANQDSNNLVVFSIEAHSGRLAYLSSVECPAPVCVAFYPTP